MPGNPKSILRIVRGWDEPRADTPRDTPEDGRPALSLGGLELFGVPHLIYGSDGRCVHVSAAAAELMNGPARFDALRQQCHRLAAEALAAPRLRGAACEEVARVPASCGPYALAVYALRFGGGSAAPRVVVVMQPSPAHRDHAELLHLLTPREREVAALIARGQGAKQIGAALGISTHTARHHTEGVFSKLGVSNRASVAALFATAMGPSSHGLDRDASPNLHGGFSA